MRLGNGTYDGTVSVIDSFYNTVAGSPINVGQFPVGIAYSPHSMDMYVVNNKDGMVSDKSV
jgi:DNA-binding beta-propeller fold protein YncE